MHLGVVALSRWVTVETRPCSEEADGVDKREREEGQTRCPEEDERRQPMIDGPLVNGVVDQRADGRHDRLKQVEEANQGIARRDRVVGRPVLCVEKVDAEGLDRRNRTRAEHEEEDTCTEASSRHKRGRAINVSMLLVVPIKARKEHE